MNLIFITGTDTDSGKTYSTCQLLKALHEKGYRAEALKPIASGCIVQNGELVSQDAVEIKTYSNLTLDQINPWRFEPPVSPHIAAAQQGVCLSAKQIRDYCLEYTQKELDYLLIEGAGGLMVPLNESETWLDFLTLSQIPVILTVGIKLGCINHALLTQEVLNQHQISCLGWIANRLNPETLVIEEIIQTLEAKMSSPKIAEIPYGGRIDEFFLKSRLFF